MADHCYHFAAAAECRSCLLVLPADAYPRDPRGVVMSVTARYHGWCTQCIRDDQAREHGLAASVLRDRATLRRTIALEVDDRMATA
jgi:hypothetical protein